MILNNYIRNHYSEKNRRQTIGSFYNDESTNNQKLV